MELALHHNSWRMATLTRLVRVHVPKPRLEVVFGQICAVFRAVAIMRCMTPSGFVRGRVIAAAYEATQAGMLGLGQSVDPCDSGVAFHCLPPAAILVLE